MGVDNIYTAYRDVWQISHIPNNGARNGFIRSPFLVIAFIIKSYTPRRSQKLANRALDAQSAVVLWRTAGALIGIHYIYTAQNSLERQRLRREPFKSRAGDRVRPEQARCNGKGEKALMWRSKAKYVEFGWDESR